MGSFAQCSPQPVALTIVGTRRDGDALIVQYMERAAATTAPEASEPRRPFALAGVLAFAGPVRFERVERVDE